MSTVASGRLRNNINAASIVGPGNTTAAAMNGSGGLTAVESPVKPVLDMATWTDRLQQADLSRQYVDDLVMNYLVIEGYKDAAECFQADLAASPSKPAHRPNINFSSIEGRMLIRSAIQQGRIEEAVTRINDFDCEILDNSPRVWFHLLLQRMIELIREERWEDALALGERELAKTAVENADYLEEFEEVMLLLVFDASNRSNPARDLLSAGQRLKTANEVNVALLASQGHDQGIIRVFIARVESKLPLLIRTLKWMQSQLATRTTFPQLSDFANPRLTPPSDANEGSKTIDHEQFEQTQMDVESQ